MVRVKEAYDWSLTWSPNDDVRNIPDFWQEVMQSPFVTRYYAILERHDAESKWHLHIGFSTKRSYSSDYKWWKEPAKDMQFEEPALDIHYHNNLTGLVGGYCSKAQEGDREFVGSKGFTDEQLQYGKELYERGLRKQRIRRWVDKFHNIQPDKLEVVIGAQMHELSCDQNTAILSLAQDGWAFARSQKGLTPIYRDMYAQEQELGGDISRGSI